MDSKGLLAKQFHAHVQVLTELLSSPGGERPSAEILHRNVLGARMLAGSTSVMGLAHWSELSAAYGELLQRYERNGYPWDDRVADVTSELIEKEETLMAVLDTDPSAVLDEVIPNDEIAALISELGVLDEEFASLPEARATEPVEMVVDIDLDADHAAPEVNVAPVPPPAAVIPLADAAAVELADEPVPAAPETNAGPLPGIVAELRGSFRRLEALMATPEWASRAWESTEISDIRRELNTIDFCSLSIERVVADHVNGSSPRPRCTLEPLRVALCDYASELSRGTGRILTVELAGVDHTIDPGLLSTAGLILQSMITDTFQRCEREPLRVEVHAEVRYGALHWRVTDDGDNFVTDSRLDNDEQLAFYPRLRSAINRLTRYYGALWVEPGAGPRSRFEFTLPATLEREPLVVWGNGNQAFATRATQVCAVIAADDACVKSDSHGPYVELDGARVPLLRLDGLYKEAPSHGDRVAVIGSVEKRIAFYAPGDGTPVEAHVSYDAIPAWQGAPSRVVRVDDRRLPLLDADYVVEAYHSATGTLDTEPVSGGVQDGSDLDPHQATSKVDAPAPPESTSEDLGENGVDVLVVEQSESMREALTKILDDHHVRSTCVVDVEEAIAILGSQEPRLIISEFRMPTMAAKRVVDTIEATGRRTPVLVTTSQTGKTADLLVEKLGVSGYLSKPLDPLQVSSTVSTFLGEGVAR